MPDINSTNHGLSVLTNAPARQRLQWPFKDSAGTPKIFPLSNCFNNATTGDLTPAFSSGHEGLDFACDVGNKVCAMYGGTVTVLTNASYDLHVKIRSYTNADRTMGFEHLYAHLNSVAEKFTGATPETTVGKGEEIGLSGFAGIGSTGAHLHVHVKPFDASGEPTHEFAPANATDKEILEYSYPPLATRISGTMNFACFLPADHGGPAITADGLLLSARDSDAQIPVYTAAGGPIQLGTSAIDGSKIGCYAVKETQTLQDGTNWYKIQLASGPGWVSQMGDVGGQRVQWVRVENTRLVVSTDDAGTQVRSAPGIATDAQGLPIPAGTAGNNVRGTLTRNQHYPILGTFEDLTATDPTKRRWWQIDLEGTNRWVRNDVVTEHGDLSRVPGAWPPAPANLQTDPRGATVRLTWMATAWPDDTPQHLRDQLAGYQIERYEPPSAFSPGAPTAFSEVSATTHTWTDTTVAAVPQALVYYRVAALAGTAVGAPSGYRSATTGMTSTNPGPNPGPENDVGIRVRHPFTLLGVPLGAPLGPGARITPDTQGMVAQARFDFEGFNRPQDVQLKVHVPDLGGSQSSGRAAGGASGRARSAVARSGAVEGWVPMSVLEGGSNWATRVRALPQPPFVRVTAPGLVPVRPGPSLGYTTYVAQIERAGGWYELMGENQGWWQVRVDAATVGWLQGSQVETTHRDTLTAVPFVDESPAPEPAGPGGTLPSGNAVTRDSGHYLNLANSWGGRVGRLQGRHRGDGGLPEHALASAMVRAH